MKVLLSFFLLMFTVLTCNAQETQVNKKILPKNSLFEPLMLDPIECVPYLCFLGYSESGLSPEKIYVPFSMSMQKVIIRWEKDSVRAYELGFDAGAFTQFEWVTPGNKWQRNILNSDFKGSWFLNYRFNSKLTLRTRFYHISSHLGDDYIIRNKINYYTPNAVNYEQLDFIASYLNKSVRYYGGAGMVVRPETLRKRFSTQCGFLFNKSIFHKRAMDFIFGSDIKIFAQNKYDPNIKVASGIRFGKMYHNPVSIVLEYYQGHLPYSVYESKKVKWFGLSFYFNPI